MKRLPKIDDIVKLKRHGLDITGRVDYVYKDYRTVLQIFFQRPAFYIDIEIQSVNDIEISESNSYLTAIKASKVKVIG
jgi:hypothetical protein